MSKLAASEPRRGRGVRHWLVFVFGLAVLVAMLFIQGISAHRIGASATAKPGAFRGSPLAHGGPMFAWENGRLTSLPQPPRRTVALTFDDGPAPAYTPRILAILRHYHVPASFFLVGSQAVRFPDLVRAEVRAGYDVGNHTFTHVDPANIPPWQATAQIDMTQSAIAGASGIEPRLYRPPYSSSADAVTPYQMPSLQALAKRGFVVTLTNFDSEDWTAPGVGTIVQNATPPHDRGGIILMHDGGGNRAQTVKALDILIPKLLSRGYHFTTVSQIAGLPHAVADMPAPDGARLRGQVLITALRSASLITSTLMIVVLGVGVLTLGRMLVVLALARRHARSPRRAFDPLYAPPVSIVVPAYNEEVDIVKSVTSLAASDYPELEVLVVDDGSTDGTAALVDRLQLDRVRLIRQPNAGKAAALNRGIAHAEHELVVTVDADTVFEADTLRQLVQPFREAGVGAVSGNTKVGNRRRMLGRWQHIEYVMGFNLDRRMYEVLNCMPCVPGAIGAFRRSAVIGVGGFSGATLAEDTDITLALGRAGWRVVYVQEARAWTEAPSSLAALWRQRYRWAYGTLQSVWKHRGALREPGPIGRRGIPYLAVFQIGLPFAAPLIDLFALYGLIFLSPLPVLAYWLGFNLVQMTLAVYAFHLDGERRHVLWALPLQQLVYRQLMYLVIFESAVSAARGVRLRWHHLSRTGELEVGGRPARTGTARARS
jgi:cellulose synthase/poly-beta-1,6-N-acetylglucosamine synthase-like glycosyltransferase/peptidoglycan/xylan/chitin deacetylase (PgdA/CDA1 family)